MQLLSPLCIKNSAPSNIKLLICAGANPHVLRGPNYWVFKCSISPDSSMIASLCNFDSVSFFMNFSVFVPIENDRIKINADRQKLRLSSVQCLISLPSNRNCICGACVPTPSWDTLLTTTSALWCHVTSLRMERCLPSHLTNLLQAGGWTCGTLTRPIFCPE